jgi:hypothetical protein
MVPDIGPADIQGFRPKTGPPALTINKIKGLSFALTRTSGPGLKREDEKTFIFCFKFCINN